ncbi:MAG: hypothetical protein GY790_11855, partial [Bacteroidetes bacterium]|nr:hypothetical protein [Bacteroidota bacterium]
SARFSGDDSYLEIPEDPDLDIMDQLTIALSLKIDTIPDMIEPLLSKPDHVADSVGNYALFIDPGLHIIFAITASDGTVHQHISTYTLTQGAWHLITATFNGVELNTYLDGIADLAAPATGITMKEDDNALIIGNQGAGSKSFLIDDFRLFQRAMDVEEILEFKTSHMPNEHGSPQTFSACVGDTMEIQPDVSGPFLMYTFSRDGIVLQDGPSSSLSIPITSEEDFGQYQCTISNGYGSIVINLEVESGKLYDNLYIYDVAATEIHASNGDNVNLWFYVNSNLEYLVYEMYHNGNLIPDVFRGIYTIDQATMTDTGAYYFVVLNGCERLVSDTVHLIMEGQEYINYKVAGWDWTGNISGSGSSYFSSISAGSNGSFHLLGHFGGGLKV